MSKNSNFFGRDGFYWFVGVVEDRQDPLKLGRVRVRVLGCHPEDKTLVPTEDLPWASIVLPNSASMCGVGESPNNLVPGDWVLGFFRDGMSAQEPTILGSLPGIHTRSSTQFEGFSDPRNNPQLIETLETAPKEVISRTYHTDGSGVTIQNESVAKTNPRFVNEPDTDRLARNEKIEETIIQVKKDNRDLNIPRALGGSWSEPETSYNAKYPYNHVKKSESGHIEEVDDTPGSERLSKWHRTGTSEEINSDGTKIIKVVGDNVEIVMKDNKIHIMGTNSETCNKDYDLYIKGNFNIQVDGNINIVVNGNVFQKVEGSVNQIINGDVKQQVNGNFGLKTSGKVDIKSDGDVNIDGAHIWLNSERAAPDSPEEPNK